MIGICGNGQSHSVLTISQKKKLIFVQKAMPSLFIIKKVRLFLPLYLLTHLAFLINVYYIRVRLVKFPARIRRKLEEMRPLS